MMGFGMLPTTMTPELSNLLLAIDAVALVVFVLAVGSSKLAAGSGRLAKLFASLALVERFKLWREAQKSH